MIIKNSHRICFPGFLVLLFIVAAVCYVLYYSAEGENVILQKQAFVQAKNYNASEIKIHAENSASYVLNEFPKEAPINAPFYLPFRQETIQIDTPVFAQLNRHYFAMGNIYENIWYNFTYYC